MSLTNPVLKKTGGESMKIEKVRERIKELEGYVHAYESYEPGNMKETAVKLYAELNNVSAVAEVLNAKGYRKEGKLVAGKRAQVKLDSNDVTGMLNSEVEADDLLHSIVKKVLNQNRKRKGIVV